MLGFAIVNRQHDAGATAVWLTSREGARVTNTSAGVMQHHDETYISKIQALIAKRAVVLSDGTVPPAEFAHGSTASSRRNWRVLHSLIPPRSSRCA